MIKKVVVESAQKTAQNKGKPAGLSDGRATLDCRYGEIGISAVAAAVRYQGAAKNSAYAPVPIQWDDRAGEAA